MQNKFTLLLNKFGMGNAPRDLSHTLITNYLNLLIDNNAAPAFICCYGEGVQLCCPGSPIIEALKELEAKGTHIVVCKTCLNYMHLLDQIAVGTVGTMQDIVEVQLKSTKVITL